MYNLRVIVVVRFRFVKAFDYKLSAESRMNLPYSYSFYHVNRYDWRIIAAKSILFVIKRDSDAEQR